MMAPEQDDEQELHPRGRPRVPVDYPVQFTGDEGSGYGTVTNLTLAGGEVDSQIQLSIGARVCLHVQPPGARPPIIITLAIIRWKQGDRFGIEFVRFEGTAKEQLKEMLNQGEGPVQD
ncbi:MAG: PilZ domain-containing protein [Nitrospira sp.]|nr:MAG: PilZ domain-containing protein [Nitrospira sp.]